MKVSSLNITAFFVLLLEFSSANNLRQGEQTENFEPSRDLNVLASCGNGSVGNAICPDSSMCCSEWGWCGTIATGHCDEVNPSPQPNEPTLAPAPAPIMTSPPTDGVGTCGNESVGNGICPDSSMCCSEWGWCGTIATGHCDGVNPPPQPNQPTLAPVPAPITPSPPTDGIGGEASRLIAYLGNWQACPSDQQLEQYTHIVIAFAVSYTWSSGKNICSETCDIATPPVCDNAPRPDLIANWKDAGKKIILSFGGAGMGGSWDGDNNDCWDYCFGRETQVVNRLTGIVNEMGLDGVDIDYEYFYDDNSGFTKGAQARKFLEDVTLGLRNSMPAGAELTHAPMEPDVVPGKGYYNVLKKVASSLDFLMPQYYNGYIRPNDDFPSALNHYSTITNDIFGGDASKVVFGFCIQDCGSFNLNGPQSAKVMEELAQTYPCNGGAFFWVANDDVNGAWSIPVSEQLRIDSDQCLVDAPVAPSSAPPVDAPVAPASAPSSAPQTQPACEDDQTFRFKNKNNKNCNWVGKGKNKKRKKKCNKNHGGKKVKEYCPKACKVCE